MNNTKSNIKKNILIIGTSGHAKVIIDIVEREGKYNIFGLIDTYKEIGGKTFEYSILGSENHLPLIMKENDIYGGIIAIGDNNTRKRLYERILKIDKGFNFVNAIHPKAVIGSGVEIGSGVVIMPGVVVSPYVTIGDFCILNTKSILGSESLMCNYSSLGPGTNIGENVSIGICSAISLGAKIIESINIGSHSIIGAGSIVVNDISNKKVAFGIPAKEIRDREKGEFYLSGNKEKKI